MYAETEHIKNLIMMQLVFNKDWHVAFSDSAYFPDFPEV
jgi:hypothetical protein